MSSSRDEQQGGRPGEGAYPLDAQGRGHAQTGHGRAHTPPGRPREEGGHTGRVRDAGERPNAPGRGRGRTLSPPSLATNAAQKSTFGALVTACLGGVLIVTAMLFGLVGDESLPEWRFWVAEGLAAMAGLFLALAVVVHEEGPNPLPLAAMTPQKLPWRERFRRWRLSRRPHTICWCPGCREDLTINDSFVNDDGEVVQYVCAGCGAWSRWLFDCVVPILLEWREGPCGGHRNQKPAEKPGLEG